MQEKLLLTNKIARFSSITFKYLVRHIWQNIASYKGNISNPVNFLHVGHLYVGKEDI